MVSIEDFGSSRRGSNPLTTTRPKWSNYVYSIIILRCEVQDGIFIGMIFNQLLKHKTQNMIIPLNLPGERSKALSIVATTEGYSVALVDIVDGYGLHACESYEPLIPTDEEVIEPIIWFNKQLAKGPDLLQCLNDAMSALTK